MNCAVCNGTAFLTTGECRDCGTRPLASRTLSETGIYARIIKIIKRKDGFLHTQIDQIAIFIDGVKVNRAEVVDISRDLSGPATATVHTYEAVEGIEADEIISSPGGSFQEFIYHGLADVTYE